MRPLAINDEVRMAIRAAVKRARQHPIDLKTVEAAALSFPQRLVDIKLSDRKPGWIRPQSENVLIPHGYRAAVSFEEQPIGLCIHLSVSVDAQGMLPNELAFNLIAEEFGVYKTKAFRVWIEEYEPGYRAINLVAKDPQPQ
jgi:hypothetical protein